MIPLVRCFYTSTKEIVMANELFDFYDTSLDEFLCKDAEFASAAELVESFFND